MTNGHLLEYSSSHDNTVSKFIDNYIFAIIIVKFQIENSM